MSDCGVCIGGYGYGECTGYQRRIGKAGREWHCSECGCSMPKGTVYELASWFSYGSFGNAKTCLICAEIAEAFMCGARWHGGILWDSMDEVMGELTTSCFDKLKTPEAKAELQRRWMVWKGLVA
jgi:hypothetical protein